MINLNTHKNNRIQYFSLIEMLIYIFTLSALSLFLFSFFHSTVKINRQALVRTERYQEVARLHKEWKAFIAQTRPDEWRINDGPEFLAGTHSLTETWVQVPVYTFKPTPRRQKKKQATPEPLSAFDFFGPQSSKHNEEDENDVRDDEVEEPPANPPEIRYVMRKNGTLTLKSAQSSKQIRLPQGAALRFAIEPGAPPLATLTLVFPGSPGFKEETVRLVAVSHREGVK